MCDQVECGTIFTGDRGVPISVHPCRDDFVAVLSYHHALWQHRDAVRAHFSLEFQKSFGKALRKKIK